MLPFTKRPARSESPELINTGDIEVVRSPETKRAGAFPKPASDRPRVFTRSASDDEMTTLLPRKGMTFSVRPGAPVTPVPMAKRISTNPPKPQLEEPPTRQFVRPSAPPPSISPVAGPPRASNRPPPSSRPGNLVHARSALRPQPVPVIGDDRKSDPRIDPPATVITARTRVVAARPTISWAAALVTMGVFVGLVTAVVARGDADTLIDAAASFVDPSGSHAAAAGSETMAVHTKAAETHTNVVVTADTLLAPDPAADGARIAWEQQSAVPAPPRPAPVAYAAPVHHAAHPAARPAPAAPAHEERVATAKPAPAPKAAPASKPSRANDDDMESASAADALAKAQLEASLR